MEVAPLAANSLTDAGFPVPNSTTGEIGLIGLLLNPNTAQSQIYTIVDNTSNQLFTDAADGDMTLVATSGNAYIGVVALDELIIVNAARVSTVDNVDVTGTTTVDGSSVLSSNNVNIP